MYRGRSWWGVENGVILRSFGNPSSIGETFCGAILPKNVLRSPTVPMPTSNFYFLACYGVEKSASVYMSRDTHEKIWGVPPPRGGSKGSKWAQKGAPKVPKMGCQKGPFLGGPKSSNTCSAASAADGKGDPKMAQKGPFLGHFGPPFSISR